MTYSLFAIALFLFQTDDTTAAPPTTGGSAILEMLRNSGPIALIVLGLLLVCSLWSWAVILGKWASFRRASAQSRKFLRAFRKADDPLRPIGPVWIEGALLDLTALGGPIVLGLVVLAVVGFLLLQARYRSAVVVALTALSGELLNAAMKSVFMRPRPEVVPGFLTVGQARRNIVTGAFGRTFNWSERSSKHIAFDLRGPKSFSWRKSLKSQ